MKTKLILLVSLFIACITMAAPAVNDLISKIAFIPAERIIGGAMVGKIIDDVMESTDVYKKIHFDAAYYDVRDAVFSQEEVAKIMHTGDQQWYYSARTLFITKIKCYLHKDGNLNKVYLENYREPFIQKVSGLPQDKKEQVRTKIKSAYAIFTMLKTPAVREAFAALQKAEEEGQTYNLDLRILSRNLSENDVAREIENGALAKREKMEALDQEFCQLFEDGKLAKFAGRRAVEGGDELLDQYIIILKGMMTDIK